jgi:hypothetical protein
MRPAGCAGLSEILAYQSLRDHRIVAGGGNSVEVVEKPLLPVIGETEPALVGKKT